MMTDGWRIELNGVTISGGDEPGGACLTLPPEGLGVPGVRTEDVTLPQRDGVRHFNDWYEPRVITLEASVCPDSGCASCPEPRARVRAIQQAWKRQCDDIELVIWPPCSDAESRTNLAPTPSGDPAWEDGGPDAPPNWVIGGSTFTTTTYPAVIVPDIAQPLHSIRNEYTTADSLTGMTSSTFFPVDGPMTVTFSAWVRASIPIRARTLDPLTNTTQDATAYQSLPDWTRLTVTATSTYAAPLDAYVVQLNIESQPGNPAPAVGDFVEVAAVLAEQDGSPTAAYFDGATPDTDTALHDWSGEPYNAPSTSGPDRSLIGPFGIVGRPRPEAGNLTWLPGRSRCAQLVLRFDATDHRMFVLDSDGTPGSGVSVVEVSPFTSTKCRSYPRCYPMCYDQETGEDPGDTTTVVQGTECTQPTICFHGQLTNPILENVTTGETIGYQGTITAGSPPVCVDTETGLAEQGGANRTHLITGNPQMSLQPGENLLRLRSFSSTDDGTAELTYRSIVVSA